MSLVQEAIRAQRQKDAAALAINGGMTPRPPPGGRPQSASPRMMASPRKPPFDRVQWLERVRRRREAEFVQTQCRKYLGIGNFAKPKYWCPDPDKLSYNQCIVEVKRIKEERTLKPPGTPRKADDDDDEF